MRKAVAFVAAAALGISVLAGCNTATGTSGGQNLYQDGVYTAEFKEYDSHGYKDFLEVTVKDGVIAEVTYDAENEQGGLRTKDDDYKESMQAVQNTSPEKYTADLVNQYLLSQKSDDVVAIAGATYSSDSFRALTKALEQSMINGDTTLLLVDNVPEK